MRINACVVLAGGLRPSPLAGAVGVSVLDLPLRQNVRVCDLWVRHVSQLLGSEIGATQFILAYTENIPEPSTPVGSEQFRFRRECTQAGLRGPAGSVRDVCEDLPQDAEILVIEGNRYLTSDLASVLRQHRRSAADVTVACNPDHTPAGLYLLGRKTLDLIQPRGFMDLKEQWLSKVASEGLDIRVHHLTDGPAYQLRTWRQFRGAARVANGLPFAPSFVDRTRSNGVPPARADVAGLRLISESAKVGEDALVVDSVVLDNAVVEPGAVVVRSLVAAGATVRADAPAIDVIVTRTGHVGDVDPICLSRGGTRRKLKYGGR